MEGIEGFIEAKASAIILLKDHPILLVIFCIMLLLIITGAVIIALGKSNPSFLNKLFEKKESCNGCSIKSKIGSIEAGISNIEARIEKLFSIVADYELFTNAISQCTLENMVFNDTLPTFRRLKAFRRLIAMRGNGRAKKKGIEIILSNKETWHDVLDVNMNLKIVDQKYYEDVLAEIDKKILQEGI